MVRQVYMNDSSLELSDRLRSKLNWSVSRSAVFEAAIEMAFEMAGTPEGLVRWAIAATSASRPPGRPRTPKRGVESAIQLQGHLFRRLSGKLFQCELCKVLWTPSLPVRMDCEACEGNPEAIFQSTYNPGLG